jgi:TfoX/Sxy family transcriptional regulator of competence genes
VTVAQLFDDVADRLLDEDPSLGQGRMFNAVGLKTGGKLFAMVVKDELVVKLPVE